MGKYKIVFDRQNCIGAGPCVAVNPDVWEMKDDGKVALKAGTQVAGTENFEQEIDDDKLEINLQAAKSCPVNVIHIVDKETGEQLV